MERFTILGLVGRGGMGEVYAAYDPSLDRRVALKMMHAGGPAHDERARERMLREAQAIAKVSHPNVVVVYEVGTFESQIFIAMEFIEGATLDSWLKERQRPWTEILAVYLHAARGLSAAHRAGLVHRDFKPQNVMVASDGTVRVMDFGLARQVDEVRSDRSGTPGARDSGTTSHSAPLTHTGELLGTPLYMAPEQFASGRIDARTDQFSFCISLYWSLFGSHPFGADRKKDPGTSERTEARASEDKAPAWLRRVLDRGLRVDPTVRWPSMDDLVAALTPPPSRRRRGPIAVAAAAVLCALGLLGIWAVGRERAICLAGPDRMAGVWEVAAESRRATHRDAIHAAILASGVNEAASVWQRVATSLDRHATKWLVTYREACEATHVRHEQSEESLDLVMACLNDDLDSTRALTQLLLAGDPRVIGHALEATGSLVAVDRCGDVHQLRSVMRPPKDPLLRAEVQSLRRRLKDAEALYDSARPEASLPIANEVLARADVIKYCPLRAEALVVKADSIASVSEARSLPILEEAIGVGETCGHDLVVAHAATQLVGAYLELDSRLAERSAALASAALGRIGGDVRLDGWLANNLGILHLSQGKIEEATADLERAVAIKTKVLGADHPDVGRSLSNLSMMLRWRGRLSEALAANDRGSRAFATWEPDSLNWSYHLANRSAILCKLGRLDEARAVAERVRPSREWPPQYEGVLLGGLACVHLAGATTTDTITYLEKTLSAQLRPPVFPPEVAETQFQLAVALAKADRRSVRAMRLAEAALATYAAVPEFARERREVQDWLTSRPFRREDRRILGQVTSVGHR